MRSTHGLLPHIICSLLLLTVVANTSAVEIYYFGEVDDIEVATWPPYCKARASPYYRKLNGKELVSKAEVDRWKRYFGKNFQHMHHYCKGLLNQFRAGRPSWLASSRYSKKWVLRSVPSSMRYTWIRMPKTHPFYAKMSADILLAYQDANNMDKAKSIIQDLFKSKPHDLHTYTAAAKFYRKQNDLAKAIEILELGTERVKKNKKIFADLAQDYFDLKQYEKSRHYARLARSKGMKLVRLGKELKKAGFPISAE